MLCFRSNPSIIFLLFFFFFFSFDHGSSSITVIVNGKGYNGMVGLDSNIRRSVAETEYNTSLILAERRTHRRDPINNFNHYDGGYNISNGHYWASVAFTAAPLFVIAAVWFVVFGLGLSLICLCFCCCRREPYGYSRTCYALSLIFLILFTLAAIVGCVVLYTGQGKFHGKTSDTLNYVVDQADDIFNNLRNVSDYLSAAKQIGVDSIFLPKDVVDRIGNVQTKINSSMNVLSDRTGDNSKKIQHFLDKVGLALIIIAAVMLSLTFLGFLFSIFGMPCLVHTLVVLGWILVAGTFVLCGVFLLLHNVVADTCVAMDEWVQNPTAYTALDDILPCVDNATAQETLDRTQDVAYQLVNLVNGVITNISNVNYPPNLGPPLYFNQSGPLVPLLCNPLNPDRTARQCAVGEVDFNTATRVWKDHICEVSSTKICTTPGRLTPDIYNQMTASANVSYGLYHYSPFLVNLVDCTFVRETFTDISGTYCPGLRRYSQWVYIGLVMVSGAVMLSLIFWVIYARERRHRVYTKQFMDRPSEGPFGRNKGP